MSHTGRAEIPIKSCLRLHERRASRPSGRDLAILNPRSRPVGLEISHVNTRRDLSCYLTEILLKVVCVYMRAGPVHPGEISLFSTRDQQE